MHFQLTSFCYLGLLSYVKAQDACSRGACHPTTGNLLVGRSAQLSASSTCGLNGVQKYCILSYLEGEQKCFICDSRFPYDPYTHPHSHTIENVITRFEPDGEKTWWQSENGLDHVSIRLDLEALFQFSHLILTFKTFRPAAMLIERSSDYGHTWRVFRYFAKNCAASFPGIASGQAQGVGDIVCDSRYSDIEPSTGGEVVFKVLDPSFEIENPYSPYIQDLVTLTNLRINFTKLHTLGDTLLGRRQNDSLDKYYYALYEMVVRGSCFCNGHASGCGPAHSVRGDVFSHPGMVHGQCICEHNTDGPNCERCKAFFQDVPWRPASDLGDSACRACRCNSHSDRCHFDMSVYLASGGLSGGVCEDCQHNTEGQHCDRCSPLFYRDPLKAISDPYACLPCECDPDGTISGGVCVSHSDPAMGSVAGQCLCKENVEGAKCDQCKPNHYGLSAADPQGCQPCNCNPLGSQPLSVCDVDTGQCLCQSSAKGPHCEDCVVGYWGLEGQLHECLPCDCDVGGAYSNMCSPQDGQCECRPHITGRSCSEPAPGYFFAPLNFYLYEAEEAMPLQGLVPLVLATALPICDVYIQQQGNDFILDKGNILLKGNQTQSPQAEQQSEGSVVFGQMPAVHIVFREPVPGTPITWTGPGLARLLPGAGLRFAVDNIPFPMDFTIALRYEIQTTGDWAVQIMVNPPGGSEHCPQKNPQTKPQSFALPAASRMVLLPTSICLEPGVQYSIDVYFSQPLEGGSQAHSHILVDSDLEQESVMNINFLFSLSQKLGLIPKINSLENFFSKQEIEDYQLHNCVEIALETGPQVLPRVCEKLIASLSAKLHNGAMACQCHPQGSVGPNCSLLGGQCPCKPHVAGRCCDRCFSGSYGLGPSGCHLCHCHPRGSKNTVCDQITGQCPCHTAAAGQRCDRCLVGYFGFPDCRPCLCNGFAELCDPETGSCLNCRGFTTGRNCERCIDGYYGDPSSGQTCRPCQCPDVPSSNQHFAHSCYPNPWGSDVICNCLQGYAGVHCGECSAGFYGNPRISGAPCRPCACNNNIDIRDPQSCSQLTGECLRCLHDTQGPSCQFCKPGYFGSALNQTCKRCSCHPSGVNPAECPRAEGACHCDPNTGKCPCLPNVTGQTCDRCAEGFWNLVPGRGCQPCDCNPQTSHSSHCDQLTGQCACKVGYGGRRCNECEDNYFGDPLRQCIPCDCNREGTQKPICDRDTGMCHCRKGVSGPRCDRCSQGHSQEFPACHLCHLCFDQWDLTVSSLSKAVQGLMRLAANMEDKRETLPVCEADFKGLRENMSEIERILKHPVFSSGEFLKVKDYQDSLRKQILQLSEQLKTVPEFQDLTRTILQMSKTANILAEELQKEIDLHSRVHNASIMDSLKDIRNYYQRSSSTEKKTNYTISIIKKSQKTRSDLLTVFNTLVLKGNLSLEKLKQIKILDIQILTEKVCGGVGDIQCVPPSCQGQGCQGSPALSRNALQKAQETKVLVHNYNNQIQELKNQITLEVQVSRIRFNQLINGALVKDEELAVMLIRVVCSLEEGRVPEEIVREFSGVNCDRGWITEKCFKSEVKNISRLAEVSKSNASQLRERLKNMKNQSKSKEEHVTLLIKNLKKFLLEEDVPPEDIEKVANRVLDIHLPITSQNLTHELDKIRKLTQFCEDYRTDESKLNKTAGEAQKVLAKAKVAQSASNVTVLNLDKMSDKLQETQITQGRANSTITQLTAKITKIKTNVLQAENQTKVLKNQLDLAKQPSELEDGLSQLRSKLQKNQEKAIQANVQAELAQEQAGSLEQVEFVALKSHYAALQRKTHATGLTKETVGKVKQLKDAAEKLAGDTEDKIRRIADLEKKIQDLNLSKQEKADQLKQLEDQVIAIKNEIVEQEIKYSTCYT